MGNPDSRYLSNQDYGRRLYVDNASYAKQMGVGSRKPAFNQNDALYKQSEFKQPYKVDDYEEMEYLADDYPGFPNDYDYDTPFELPYPGPAENKYNPWTVRFLCNIKDACYGRPNAVCNYISCGWPIISYKLASIPKGCKFTLSNKGLLCASCPESETFFITFDVIMKARFQHNGQTVSVIGHHYDMTVSRCLCDGGDIAWDVATSATTIGRSDSAVVAITDNTNKSGSPYTWSIVLGSNGVGLTLANVTTEGLTNTVLSAADACGSATISVTGCDGSTIVQGDIACTGGGWGAWNVLCLNANADPIGTYYCTIDDVRWDAVQSKYAKYHYEALCGCMHECALDDPTGCTAGAAGCIPGAGFDANDCSVGDTCRGRCYPYDDDFYRIGIFSEQERFWEC